MMSTRDAYRIQRATWRRYARAQRLNAPWATQRALSAAYGQAHVRYLQTHNRQAAYRAAKGKFP